MAIHREDSIVAGSWKPRTRRSAATGGSSLRHRHGRGRDRGEFDRVQRREPGERRIEPQDRPHRLTGRRFPPDSEGPPSTAGAFFAWVGAGDAMLD